MSKSQEIAESRGEAGDLMARLTDALRQIDAQQKAVEAGYTFIRMLLSGSTAATIQSAQEAMNVITHARFPVASPSDSRGEKTGWLPRVPSEVPGPNAKDVVVTERVTGTPSGEIQKLVDDLWCFTETYGLKHSITIAARTALLDAVSRLQRERNNWQAASDEMDDNDVLQILCRAVDEWEPIYEEWLSWYNPTDWLHRARGFGAFMRKILNSRNVDDEKRELLASVKARYETIAKLNTEIADLRSRLASVERENIAMRAVVKEAGELLVAAIQKRDRLKRRRAAASTKEGE